nr:M23 family metallopeptidase [Kineococcus aurantiacus]
MSSSVPPVLVPLAAAGLAVAALSGPPAAPGPARTPVAAWGWPVTPHRVLRGFDDVGRYAAGHRGLDLAVSPGRPVVAVAAGSVTFAGPVAGRSVVVVLHADGVRTTYEPVAPLVTAGSTVAGGQPLGVVAATPAHCAVPCLHLGARAGEVYLDPALRLRPAAPVLLPLGQA